MPGHTVDLEPVEPLSFKSLKRVLDLFSPIHGQLGPPDVESLFKNKMKIILLPVIEFDGPPIKQTYSRRSNPKKPAESPSPKEGADKTRGAIEENHQSITNSDSGQAGGA
ncbi:protein pleiotropic regulatory locus 1 [Senna tora]|uniref:Protein pleiotropic regulatory locus 1 n=1 Tax=Senna tora TaxID=362788 RepID=A0A834T5Y9_9FABA|nr:protein pleiotropic regulatory locus 1 [Senna tora]